MYRVHTLPTKPTKDANTEESSSREGGRSALRSVEDSLVLLQALRQSRQTWLTSAFVKFSTKTRAGKGSEIWQPPHTIRFRGKCDLEIGPHVFYATSVYEVTYQPYQALVQASSPYYPPSGQRAPGWPAASYTYTPATQATSTPLQGAGAPVYAPSTTALVSSLKGAVPITNDLISQVNTAAVSNPTLANLLGLAASGKATPEQLQTLGVTIQTLAENALKSTSPSAQPQTGASAPTLPAGSQLGPASRPAVPPPAFNLSQATQSSAASNSTAPQPAILSLRPSQATPPHPSPGQPLTQAFQQQIPSQPPAMQTINKEPDVVIEFYENSYDRWTLPKELVLYERVKRWDGNSSLADIIFSTIFPFEDSQKPTAPPPVQTASPSPTVAAEPPQSAKDTIHPITLRFFNVPPAIWNLFANAAGDEERTKRIKLAIDAQLDKAAPRAYLQHRMAEGALLTQLQSTASDRYPMKLIRPAAPVTNTMQVKRRAPAAPKNAKEGSPSGAPPAKRKRTTPAKKSEPKTGKCEGCLRTPVVLVPDAPYCPTCDKAKKTTSTPTVTSGSSQGMSTATLVTSTPQQHSQPNSTTPNPTGQATPASGTAKAKKQRKPATPSMFKPSPLQTPYNAASRPPVQNYYAWQTQTPYAYHAYQPHPQPQASQGQPLPSGHMSTPLPTSAQPTAQAAPAQTGSTESTPKKSELAAMD